MYGWNGHNHMICVGIIYGLYGDIKICKLVRPFRVCYPCTLVSALLRLFVP